MGWRQRARKPVAVSRQQNQLILAIDPTTIHILGKLAIELVKLNGHKQSIFTSPSPPVTATQTFVPNGILTIPYGSISISNDTNQNVIWTGLKGITFSDGWLKESFVVNNKVFGSNGTSSFSRNGDYTGSWQVISNEIYADLRSVAPIIITSLAVYSPPSS
jgi:hypothetical protein